MELGDFTTWVHVDLVCDDQSTHAALMRFDPRMIATDHFHPRYPDPQLPNVLHEVCVHRGDGGVLVADWDDARWVPNGFIICPALGVLDADGAEDEEG